MAKAFHRPHKDHGFVHSCSACKAFDIYGYQSGWQAFVKINLLNPLCVYKCADLLLTGMVFPGMMLQPYESHIPYLLAFLADYNLYGCNWLEFNQFEERINSMKTTYNGREFDINVTSITNKASIQYSTHHTQVFETQSNILKLYSLGELRTQDANWRNNHQLNPWTGSGFQPHFQSKVNEWPWEQAGRYSNLLKQRLKNIDRNTNNSVHKFDHLPKASDLIPSCIIAPKATYSSDAFLSLEPLTPKLHEDKSVDGSQSKEIDSSLDICIESSPSHHSMRPIGEFFCSNQFFQFMFLSPCTSDIRNTYGTTTNPQPHFSDVVDVPRNKYLYGEQSFQLKSLNPRHLDGFTISNNILRLETKSTEPRYISLEYYLESPNTNTVLQWLTEHRNPVLNQQNPTTNKFSGYSVESFQVANLGAAESTIEQSVFVIELHVDTRPGKAPKASEDPISAVFWTLSDSKFQGVISSRNLSYANISSVINVQNELEILEAVIKMVRHFNPDILSGYEIQSNSWGYARTRYSLLNPHKKDNFYDCLGRVKNISAHSQNYADNVLGRHLLSLWRLLRREITLSKYTLEYVTYHCFRERIPHYSFDTLRKMWNSQSHDNIKLVINYWTSRANLVLRIFTHFEIVNQTCEKCRIIGVDFLSNLTRGSQFQVESVLCRLSRRENFVLISPSKAQVGQQNALEYIPLVMEPISKFYTDPVCVLDFRSLYPSIIIALNLCYSTCIGRVELWQNRNKLGFKHDHPLQREIFDQIGQENIYIAPNGIGYVNPKVRKSLLAQMLGEILDTRFMINDTRKNFTANCEENLRFYRKLNNKQLALKYIANVTYGYTSASFSGRMPCSELADSIVLAGREILEYSIRKIEQTRKWGIQPKVVYGDTDGIFVQLPSVTRIQAFRIGREMADMITKDTPDPILLKLEKVYSPCILMTKKRYVGNSFESGTQEVGNLDSKGIETVRRDGTPIVQKLEKRSLEILFKTYDLSQVKRYLQKQWRRILAQDIRPQEFCFAQEVKLGHYKSTSLSNIPGGAVVSIKKMIKDDGFEPQYRERVPFIVTTGPKHSRINDRVVSPEELMNSPHLTVDTEYYIEKAIIPPLERLFGLLGVKIRDWYTNMPRIIRITPQNDGSDNRIFNEQANGSLTNFVQNDSCGCCRNNRRLQHSVLCSQCSTQQPKARYILTTRYNTKLSLLNASHSTCKMCSTASQSNQMDHSKSSPDSPLGQHPCESLDCSVYYDRIKYGHDTRAALELLELL